MRYSGSKRRFIKVLKPILESGVDPQEDYYVELFCGGCNSLGEIDVVHKIGVDNNRYVIALWNELQANGMKNIPEDVSKEMYYSVKDFYLNGEKGESAYPDWLIGYVGTCCSWGGAWFNGYASFNNKRNENHIKEAYNGLAYQVENFKHLDTTEFIYMDYRTFFNETTIDPSKCIVYLDPPYANTKKYESDFDNRFLFQWIRNNAPKFKKLYLSEYHAPADFKCIWKMQKKDGMGIYTDKLAKTVMEKLFVLNNENK